MKSYLLIPVLLALSATAFAEPTCNVPKEKWIKESTFKQSLEAQGYKIKTLKVTNGCYELYGHDKDGKRIEMSFDPETGHQAK
jgi:hypothetical protein